MSEAVNPWMWFGKLPGLGDFAHRRMPETLREQLDAWLQLRLHTFSLTHPEAWSQFYLSAPVWRFIWGSSVTNLETSQMLTGICMPSVDRVGRYFPLIVIGPCAGQLDASNVDFLKNDFFLTSLSKLAYKALDEDWDAEDFDRALCEKNWCISGECKFDGLIRNLSGSNDSSMQVSGGSDLAGVLAAQTTKPIAINSSKSLWYRPLVGEPSDEATLSALVCSGLPSQEEFIALLGCCETPNQSNSQDLSNKHD